MTTTLLVAMFGAVGVIARYMIDLQVQQWALADFPISTFAINCIGSFAIGMIYIGGAEAALLSKELATALTVGLLGGFTTFSAFSIQTFQLIERGKLAAAALYLIGSPLLGVACATVGVFVARVLWVGK